MSNKDEEFGKYEIIRIMNAYKRQKKIKKNDKMWKGREYSINDFLDDIDNFVDQTD